MMTNTEPRRTVNVRSRIRTKLPYAIVRPSTRMWAPSDAEDMEDDREDAVRDDHVHDGEDRRARRGVADGRGALSRAHSLQAPGERDQHAEDDALADARPEVRHGDRPLGLLPVLPHTQVEHAGPDDDAAQDADEVRVDREQRHHERE